MEEPYLTDRAEHLGAGLWTLPDVLKWLLPRAVPSAQPTR